MVMPSGKRSAFEMVEAELGLEVLILLLDRPALMRESYDLRQRGGRRQVDEIELGAGGVADIALGQEPDFGREPRMMAVDRGGDADGDTVRGPPTRLGTIAPMDPSPSPACRHDGLAEPARAGACREPRMRARTAMRARRRGSRRGVPRKTVRVERNPHRIGQAQPVQHRAKQTIVTKFHIRQDARHRESARPDLAQQPERLAPFFLKAERDGNRAWVRAAAVSHSAGTYRAAPKRYARAPVHNAAVTAT